MTQDHASKDSDRRSGSATDREPTGARPVTPLNRHWISRFGLPLAAALLALVACSSSDADKPLADGSAGAASGGPAGEAGAAPGEGGAGQGEAGHRDEPGGDTAIGDAGSGPGQG